MDQFLSWLVPILIGFVSYLGHRAVDKIDQDIADLNKTTLKTSLSVSDLQKHVLMLEAQGKANNAEIKASLDLAIYKLSAEVQEMRKILDSVSGDVAVQKENYGKVIQILNKLVVIRQLQSAKKQHGS